MNFSIKAKYLLISLIVISIFSWNFYSSLKLSEDASKLNKMNFETLKASQESLNSLSQSLGYLGFIHHFKNFILRQRHEYYLRAKNSLEKSKKSIKNLQNILKIKKIDEDQFKKLLVVLEKYRESLEIANKLYASGSIKQLDNLVKVDDSPAQEAIYWLSDEVKRQIKDLELTSSVYTKLARDRLKRTFFISLIAFLILITIFLYFEQRAIKNELIAKKKTEELQIISEHNSRLASIGLLAAGVAHEVNNPLAIIQGNVDLMSKKMEKTDAYHPLKLNKQIYKINLSIERIVKIIKGLRLLARDESEKNELFSPIEAINESLFLVKNLYKKEGILLDIKNNIDKDVYLILGSTTKFQQILMNLLSNSRDAILGSSDATILINCSVYEDNFAISFEDNGPGIEINLHDKIFDTFFTTKDSNNGTGLGLALVHRFVTEMGGFIYYDSTFLKGARFILRFPIASVSKSQKKEMTHSFDKFEDGAA